MTPFNMFGDEPTVWQEMANELARREANRTPDQLRRDDAIRHFNGATRLEKILRFFRIS